VNRLLGGLLLALVACRPPHPARRAARHPADSGGVSLLHIPHDSIHDQALATPRVITRPTVVVFWLKSSDTLSQDSAQDASRDLDYYTEQVAATLAHNDIALVPTQADTVYVEQADHKRRAISLVGLDYPYGYLLIDPGTPERILTGVYDDDDLLDELSAYFDIDEQDTTRAAPRVIT
jgi:hypothetical protein